MSAKGLPLGPTATHGGSAVALVVMVAVRVVVAAVLVVLVVALLAVVAWLGLELASVTVAVAVAVVVGAVCMFAAAAWQQAPLALVAAMVAVSSLAVVVAAARQRWRQSCPCSGAQNARVEPEDGELVLVHFQRLQRLQLWLLQRFP